MRCCLWPPPEPGCTLALELATQGVDEPVLALLSVRDARLTTTDRAYEAVGASLKRGVDDLVSGMRDEGFRNLGDLDVPVAPMFVEDFGDVLVLGEAGGAGHDLGRNGT